MSKKRRKYYTRTIRICEDCYELRGDMCNDPECVFIRQTMGDVGTVLDMTVIRPIVDGKRLRL